MSTGSLGVVSRTRPLDDELTARLLETARELLQERGPESLRLDEVVARCRTSKSAVYRRWPDRQRLIAAAIDSFAWDDVRAQSGDAAADLAILIGSWVFRAGRSPEQASQLVRSITGHELSREHYERALWPRRRAMLAETVADHVPGLRPELIPEAVLRLPQAFVVDAVVARRRTLRPEHVEEFVRQAYLPLVRSLEPAARSAPEDPGTDHR